MLLCWGSTRRLKCEILWRGCARRRECEILLCKGSARRRKCEMLLCWGSTRRRKCEILWRGCARRRECEMLLCRLIRVQGLYRLSNAVRLPGCYSCLVHSQAVRSGGALHLKHEVVLCVHEMSGGRCL